MKNLGVLVFLAGLLFINSCNTVDVPQQAANSPTFAGDTVRKILLENIVGHTCYQCSGAERLIDSLENLYPGQVIPMNIHTGWFAEPCPPHPLPNNAPAGSFGEDFRVPLEDAEYNTIFGTDNWALPTGMANRYCGYPSPYPTIVNDWDDTIAFILQDSISAYIKIHPAYNQSSRELHLTVSGVLYDTLAGNYDIAVYIVENNLHGWMINDQQSGPYIDSNYVFNHVFRGCVNNPGHVSGMQILSGTNYPGTLINYNMSTTYTLPAAFNESNCKLVGILYDAATYRVVQADMVDLM